MKTICEQGNAVKGFQIMKQVMSKYLCFLTVSGSYLSTDNVYITNGLRDRRNNTFVLKAIRVT